MSMKSYEERLQEQIDQYMDQPIHDLPEIFHHWSHNYVRPGLLDVFGVESINDFYARAAEEASEGFSRPSRIMSIGCGDGDVEIALAKSLLARGISNFVLIGLDVSPILIERFQVKIRENSLSDCVIARISDVNSMRADETYDMIMANHCLHHIVELEGTFDFIYNSLNHGGIFATNDMIGRNGHMRWPETEAIIQAIWPLLSDKQKFHHQLMRLDLDRFVDHDCSGEGFEGIRAEDILYLILRKFKSYRFFGYGGFIDLIVDRGYGPGYDAGDEGDRAFITFLSDLNEMMLDGGMIKPTIVAAYFTKDDRGEIKYRNRTAENSLRLPFSTPSWAKWVGL